MDNAVNVRSRVELSATVDRSVFLRIDEERPSSGAPRHLLPAVRGRRETSRPGRERLVRQLSAARDAFGSSAPYAVGVNRGGNGAMVGFAALTTTLLNCLMLFRSNVVVYASRQD
jgi:hypothetical protein